MQELLDQSRYRMLAEAMGEIVAFSDEEGKLLYVSPMIEDLTGIPASEMIGRKMRGLLAHPEDLPLVTDAMNLVHAGGTPRFTWRIRRSTGEYTWVETHATRIHDEKTGAARVVGVTRNIEPRKSAEAALREMESSMRALVDRAAFGIFRTSLDGRFLSANPALVQMLGYPDSKSVLAISLHDDVFWDDIERARWVADLSHDKLSEWYEVAWRCHDGARIQVRLAPRTARDAHGRPVAIEGIVENVTERLRRQAHERQAERIASLGRTLAGVAHEVNNPLAAISGFAQILLRGKHTAEDRRALETILHESRRAARIVKDLLTIARRQESTQLESIDVNAVTSYIAKMQRYAIETRGIVFDVDLAPEEPSVVGDPSQLEQVLLNLVINARQAQEALLDRLHAGSAQRDEGWTPRIAIRTWVDGSNVHLEVTDNGPGIPAKDLPRIWDPFWTSKDEGEGSGLGLAVVLGIVESHHGTITVDSRLALGTRFEIVLPRETAASPPVASREVNTGSAAGDAARAVRPLDILVVDDEAVLRDLLSRVLSARGHAVVTAVGGEHAIRFAEQTTFDVVLCDLRMPGLDGRETIARLRTLPTCTRTHFVLSTGDPETTQSELAAQGIEIDALVTKPYNVDVLLRAVEVCAAR